MAHGEIAVALTIAGSDCSAGAGAQADLKTFQALGVYGLTAITCVVAETPGNVARIQAVDADVVAEQITLLLDAFPIGAIKTGLLYSGEIVARVAQTLRQWMTQTGATIPLIVDPVMVATSGDLLLRRDAIEIYERELFPLATLLTPNMDEAAALLGETIDDLDDLRRAGERLAKKYGVSILMKGGHLGGDAAIDLLFAASGELAAEFTAPFSRGVHTHGTGCTYSAAIAASIASGLALEDAIRQAKDYVTRAISQHLSWSSVDRESVDALNHSCTR